MRISWLYVPCISMAMGISAHSQSVETLPIGPGDLLHIKVYDTPEMEQHDRVTDAGTIALSLGGTVKVVGLDPIQARHEIEQVLISEQIMLRPAVTVTVEEYASDKVSILGEVKAPGAYSLRTSKSVLEVLSLAGGLTDGAERRIAIQRHGTTTKTLYYVANDAGSAIDTAVLVSPGDTVYVPRAGIAFALGDLRMPGGYTMTNNEGKLTVLQLVARAGGVEHTGSAGRTRLVRKTSEGYTEINLPLKDMLAGKQPDMLLQPDDIVYVPFSFGRNAVITGTSIIGAAGSAAVYRF